jgi:anti-anti-sigma factor
MQLQTTADILPPIPALDLSPHLWVEAIPTCPAEGARIDSGPAAVHLMVSGDLDEATSTSMEAAALAALESEPDLVVLDLYGLLTIDSAGLRAIVAAADTAERMDVRLLVGGMSGGVERLLELTGLAEQLRHVDNWRFNPN